MFVGMGFRVAYSNGKKEADAIQPDLDDAVEFACSTLRVFGPGSVTIKAEAISSDSSKEGGNMDLVEEAKKIIDGGGMSRVMTLLTKHIDDKDAPAGLLESIGSLVNMLESAREHGIDVSKERKLLTDMLKDIVNSSILDSVVSRALDSEELNSNVRKEIAAEYVSTYIEAKTIAALITVTTDGKGADDE